MPKMTSEQLQAAQTKRAELAAKMAKFAADNEKNWTAENNAVWDQMNSEYDTTYAAIQDHESCVAAEAQSSQAAQARAERLAAINQHGNRFSQSQASHLQAFGGANPGQFQNFGQSAALRNMTPGQIAALGFASWLGGHGDERALAAFQATGINPGARELVIDLSSTDEILNIQSAVQSRDGNEIRRVQNAQSENIGAAGGFLQGTTFIPRLETAMLLTSGMMQVAEIITTDGAEEMRWPTVNDTGNEGRLLGENKVISETALTFGQNRWYAHKFSSDMILVPYELLSNNAVNLESIIPNLCGERLARIVNRKTTLGHGAGEPRGIVTASSTGKTAAGAAAIVFDEVIDLEHAVNPAIRNDRTNCGYMLNDTTLKLLRKLKDGQSRYLWQSGANTGAPDTLNTYRYTINTHMADPASGAKSLLFGRLSSYKLRMVRRIRFRKLEERYADTDQVAFIMFIQADGNLLNAGDNPVQALLHP